MIIIHGPCDQRSTDIKYTINFTRGEPPAPFYTVPLEITHLDSLLAAEVRTQALHGDVDLQQISKK